MTTSAAAPDTALEQKIIATVDSLRAEILETSRWLHAHPELSSEEHESSKYLAARATARGFEVEHGLANLPTSFRGIRTGGKVPGAAPRSSIAFLAEYDALPTVGHGCGHNMIGTASTYAAVALASVAERLPKDVALFGTPAEETDGGKITMLDAGAFEGVSAALMAHPGNYTEVAYVSLACIPVVVEYHGRSAHAAASPWKGINALDALRLLFNSVDALRTQLSPSVRMPGVILKGGERANMIPDHTVAEFTIRGKDRAEAEDAHARFMKCAQAAADAIGATLEHRYQGNAYWEMRPDPNLGDAFRRAWQNVGGEAPETEPKPHGSLDIGNLSHHFPCLHPSFRITADPSIGGHTHEFAASTITPFAEDQLIRITKALALTGLAAAIDTRN